MIPEHYRPYLDLGITQWSTWDEGPIRDRCFPYAAQGRYSDGTMEEVRFGAFLGWKCDFRWWIEIGRQLREGTLREMDLFDIEHQGGGHSCIAWFCTATPAPIHEHMLGFAERLCADYYHARGGTLNGDDRAAEDIATYRDRLRSAGLEADGDLGRTGLGFMESVYPLSSSKLNLTRFLAEPEAALERLRPLLEVPATKERLGLFLLADNSD